MQDEPQNEGTIVVLQMLQKIFRDALRVAAEKGIHLNGCFILECPECPKCGQFHETYVAHLGLKTYKVAEMLMRANEHLMDKLEAEAHGKAAE